MGFVDDVYLRVVLDRDFRKTLTFAFLEIDGGNVDDPN